MNLCLRFWRMRIISPLMFAYIGFFLLATKSIAVDIQLLANTNFESGVSGWQTYAVSDGVATSAGILSCPTFTNSYSGCWYAYVGDKTPSSTHARGVLRQDITIPAYATTLTLRFYLNITSAEATSGVFDTMSAEISTYPGDQHIAFFGSWDNRNKDVNNNAKNYFLQTLPIDVSSYAGQIVIFKFYGQTDNSLYTTFRIDNVSLTATVPNPNLTPYQPAGWSDKVVISRSNTSTTDDTNLTTADTLYISFAVLNNGSGPIPNNFHSTIFVDGNSFGPWNTPLPLDPNSYSFTIGNSIGTLSVGTHSILLRADSAYEVAESNESDNEYTKTINVTFPIAAPSNLTTTSVGSGIALAWQDNSSNETGFRIQRRQGTITNYFSVGVNQTSYTDTTVSQGVQYCYTVAATNLSGSSAPTVEACATYSVAGSGPVALIAGNLTPVTGTTRYYGSYSTGVAPLNFLWTTSAGEIQTAADPQLTFYNLGANWVRLVVTDPYNRKATSSIPVIVLGNNAGTGPFIITSRDPVVLSSGNYIQSHVDLKLPGKGFPFEFRRFYNSKFSDQTGRPLGFGWTFNYNTHVIDTTSNILILQGDGGTSTFYPTNGGYVAENGVYDTLVTNANYYVLTDKSQTVSRFNRLSGQLISITDKNQNQLTCAYAGGVLSAVTNSSGRVVTFATNSYGCIATMTDPLGRTIFFNYDSSTNLVSIVDANGNTNSNRYNSYHQLTDAYDARGNRYVHNEYNTNTFVVDRQCDVFTNWTYFTYDFTNRITIETNVFSKTIYHYFDDRLLETNVIDEAGNHQIFAYDANRNRTLVQDKNGNQTLYGYDTHGNVTNKIDALGHSTSIAYDALNNPVRRIDAFTNFSTFSYDNVGNLTSTTNSLGFVTSVTYNASGLPVALIDARGFGTTNQFSPQGDLISVTDAKGGISRFEYDSAGRKIRSIDALLRTNTVSYDGNDNTTSTTNAIGSVTKYIYDANNNQTFSVNPRGFITTNLYNAKDLLVGVFAPLGQTNGAVYDPLDRKTAFFDALGNPTWSRFDDVGNLIAITNALNEVTRFLFDPNGNRTATTDPTGHAITNIFDNLNRVVMTIDVGTSTNTTGYDAVGRVVATTNGLGQVTQFFYDGIGRRTNVVDSAGQNTFFGYDQNGNRISYTDPNGNTWTNLFDELNRVIEQQNPDGTKTLLRYDLVGNVTNKITPNGDSILYAYDGRNLITNIAYPNGTRVGFVYDANGNRTKMFDFINTNSWFYDGLDRVTLVSDEFNKLINYKYDANGNRITLIYPGGLNVAYRFDVLNRMASISNWLSGVTSYVYNNRGNVTATTNANGTTATYDYDPSGRLVGLTNATATGNLISSHALTLDSSGNHRQMVQEQPLFPMLKKQTDWYSYTSDNRLNGFSTRSVNHNSNGDLTFIGPNYVNIFDSTSYSYDFEDRLTQITTTNVIASFAYDGLGNRLVRFVGGQTEHFVVDRSGGLSQVLVENTVSNTPVAYYVYGLGLVQRISAQGAVSIYHFNVQGSTISMTDSIGLITDSYAYDSFGVLANTDGESPQPFRYLGRYGILDDGTELYYARARYWNPQLSRFLTKDPLTGKDSDGQSFNRYIYALNSPLSLFDINGLCPNSSSIWSTINTTAYQEMLLLGNVTIGLFQGFVDGVSGIILLPEAAIVAAANPKAAVHNVWQGLQTDWGYLKSGDPQGVGRIVGSFAPSLLLGGAGSASANSFSSFSRASEFGIRPYSELKGLTAGEGLNAHHLIEKRFANTLGISPSEMPSVALTPAEHAIFTQSWRQTIPYGNGTVNATIEQIEAAARQIYQNHSDLLEASLKTFNR